MRGIAPYLEPGSGRPKNRTHRRHLAQYEQAKELYGNGMIGLYPHTSDQGNRTPRLQEEVRTKMTEFIEHHHETTKQRKAFSCYCMFMNECGEDGLTAPSFNTFLKMIASRPRYEQKVKRQGRRAAYGEKEFYLQLDRFTPRHGDRPFEIAHIDHTLLDVELVHLKTGEKLGRPWLTIMTDAFSRRFLGRYLTFDPPSSALA